MDIRAGSFLEGEERGSLHYRMLAASLASAHWCQQQPPPPTFVTVSHTSRHCHVSPGGNCPLLRTTVLAIGSTEP